MAYEQKDNSGSLFKNDRKESDKHPDYKGSIRINGVDYWLSAWIKRSNDKPPFMSLSVQPKEEKRSEPAAQQPPPATDDAPF
jgi:hypothetical protein